jgi:hypothetical protein
MPPLAPARHGSRHDRTLDDVYACCSMKRLYNDVKHALVLFAMVCGVAWGMLRESPLAASKRALPRQGYSIHTCAHGFRKRKSLMDVLESTAPVGFSHRPDGDRLLSRF